MSKQYLAAYWQYMGLAELRDALDGCEPSEWAAGQWQAMNARYLELLDMQRQVDGVRWRPGATED